MYFSFIGFILLVLSNSIILWRTYFVFTSTIITGTITRYRFISGVDDETGLSKHLEIRYTDLNGTASTYILDNSIMAYLYKEGETVKLAVKGEAVLFYSWIHVLTAPLAIAVIGLICLSIA
ncbi:MAG: hypothetical protein BalsKO_02730 [Balneolaceae bacterium]